MDAPANQRISPSPENPRRLLDPQLAGYDLLRRLIRGRPPFAETGQEKDKSALPDDITRELELGVRVYQIAVYLDAMKEELGVRASEAVKMNVTSLCTFDAALKAALLLFLEAARAANEGHTGGCLTEPFPGPSEELNRYYANHAAAFLTAAGCPLQPGLIASMGAWLFAAHWRAGEVFGPEVRSFGGLSESFQWSAQPGPHERQLRRQENNPFFPATARTISAGQVTEARLADLKRMSDFMSSYRPIERELLALQGKSTVKEAADVQKRVMGLIPPCMILGESFSTEMKLLTTASESIQQQLDATVGTKEPGLRSAHDQYTSLIRLQAHLLEKSVVLPSGRDHMTAALRSILSEDLGLLSSDAQALGAMGFPSDWLHGAERIMSEAIREGLDPGLGRQKLDAFRRGFSEGRKVIGKSGPRAGFWSSVKRVVRRSGDE